MKIQRFLLEFSTEIGEEHIKKEAARSEDKVFQRAQEEFRKPNVRKHSVKLS